MAKPLVKTEKLDLDIMLQIAEEKVIEQIKFLKSELKNGNIKKSSFDDAIKKARRSLGSIVTNNPNILEKELDTLFGKGDLSPERVTKHFRNYTDKITKLYEGVGKEGHHSQGIGSIRDFMVDMGYDVRKRYKEIAKLRGFDIGDEYIKYLDVAAHRKMTRGIKGLLYQYGYTLEDITPELLDAISKRMAHAKHFGGQTLQLKVPSGIVKSLRNRPETLADISSGVLAMNKAATQSGGMLDQIFSNPEFMGDLNKLYAQINKSPLIDTRPFQQGIQNINQAIRHYGPNIPDNLLKGYVDDILNYSGKVTKKIDQYTSFIPKPIKRYTPLGMITLASAVGDSSQFHAAENQGPSFIASEENIGTTNYRRAKYKAASGFFNKLGGATGLGSLTPMSKIPLVSKIPAPGLIKGTLGLLSMGSYAIGGRFDYLSKNYKSDVAKTVDMLFPHKKQSYLYDEEKEPIDYSVYHHSDDNPVEIKEYNPSFIEKMKLFTKFNL